MASGESRYAADLLAVPGLRKDGARISLEFTITLIKDDDGEVLGAAAIIRDVSVRWQRDQELKKRLAALEGGWAQARLLVRKSLHRGVMVIFYQGAPGARNGGRRCPTPPVPHPGDGAGYFSRQVLIMGKTTIL